MSAKMHKMIRRVARLSTIGQPKEEHVASKVTPKLVSYDGKLPVRESRVTVALKPNCTKGVARELKDVYRRGGAAAVLPRLAAVMDATAKRYAQEAAKTAPLKPATAD